MEQERQDLEREFALQTIRELQREKAEHEKESRELADTVRSFGDKLHHYFDECAACRKGNLLLKDKVAEFCGQEARFASSWKATDDQTWIASPSEFLASHRSWGEYGDQAAVDASMQSAMESLQALEEQARETTSYPNFSVQKLLSELRRVTQETEAMAQSNTEYFQSLETELALPSEVVNLGELGAVPKTWFQTAKNMVYDDAMPRVVAKYADSSGTAVSPSWPPNSSSSIVQDQQTRVPKQGSEAETPWTGQWQLGAPAPPRTRLGNPPTGQWQPGAPAPPRTQGLPPSTPWTSSSSATPWRTPLPPGPLTPQMPPDTLQVMMELQRGEVLPVAPAQTSALLAASAAQTNVAAAASIAAPPRVRDRGLVSTSTMAGTPPQGASYGYPSAVGLQPKREPRRQEMQNRSHQLPPDVVTLLIRNIPARCTPMSLMKVWPAKGVYNMLHMPYDFRSKSNGGKAFVNFLSNEKAIEFRDKWNGEPLVEKAKVKRLHIVPAEIQGFDAYMESVMRTAKASRLKNKLDMPYIMDLEGDVGDTRALINSMRARAQESAELDADEQAAPEDVVVGSSESSGEWAGTSAATEVSLRDSRGVNQ